jgi:restriction system protein
MLPLLQILADGQVHHVAELREQLAQHFGVSKPERQEQLKSGARRFDHNVAWARTDLGQAGALESPSRGYVRITERGRSILDEEPSKVDRRFLRRYPEFCAFMGRRRVKATVQDGETSQQANGQAEDVIPEADSNLELQAPKISHSEEHQDVALPKTLSFTDAAESVLERYANKQPMHYRAITKKILELGIVRTQGQTPEATLYAQILTEITRRTRQGNTPRFTRHGKGLVGLSTWIGGSLADRIDQHNRDARRHLLAHLGAITPAEFEALIGQLLVALGFQEVLVTGRSGDGGIDVRGTLVVGDVIRTRMAVQAKRWRANVQAPIVQQVRGSLGTHDQGLIITTSDFSSGARTEAERVNAVPVALMNGEQLVRLLVEHEIGVRRTPYELIELGGEEAD